MKITLISILIIVVINLTIYFNSIDDFFVHDTFILSSSNWSEIYNLFVHRCPDDYIRIVPCFLTLLICYDVWPNFFLPIWHRFHLLKIFSHIANSILFFLILVLLLQNRYSSLFISLLFAINPINSEAVAGTPSADVICAIFFLVSILCFIKFCVNKSRFLYIFSLFPFILALFSKEMALSLPFVIVSYDLLFNRSDFVDKNKITKKIKLYLPYFIFILVYLILRFTTKARYSGYGFLVKGYPEFSWVFKDLGLIKGTLLYIYRVLFYPYKYFLFPANRFIFTNYIFLIKISTVLITIFPVLAGIFYGLKNSLNRKLIIFGGTFIFLSCIPIFFLIHSIDYNKGGLVNSRYLYLPSIGFAILLGTAILSLQNIVIKRVLVFGVLIFYSILLFGNNLAWSEASKVSYQIPYQTRLTCPLSSNEKKTIYFLLYGDEMYFYKGVPIYRQRTFDGPLKLIYGFPIEMYIIDKKKIDEDKFFSRVSDEVTAVTENFDLRSVVTNSYILRWNPEEKKIEYLNEKIKVRLRETFLNNNSKFNNAIELTESATPWYFSWDKENPKRDIENMMLELFYKQAFIKSSSIDIPLSLIGSIEVKIKSYNKSNNKGMLAVSPKFIIDFEIISDGNYHIYNIPVKLSKMDELDKRIRQIELILPPSGEKADVSYVKIIPYNFDDHAQTN